MPRTAAPQKLYRLCKSNSVPPSFQMKAKKDWGLRTYVCLMGTVKYYSKVHCFFPKFEKNFICKHSQTFRKVAQKNILYPDSLIC